ncbi:BTB/POZ and MATH domain-containing protein 2-like [Lolium rigidum]|uniref:BTB/POZ and MATH domain-containing protein 2-like n=1 Tax=Lolium rigidum TaxID=89674 RepID=UPI001F5CAC0D|nr:BTB/POZ and MATH domain-containing protein 2-like [Lolium rigidum]
MVQKKPRSGAARGRGGAKAAARRKGTERGALRGGASAALSVEQCLLAASGGDAASGRAGGQAGTSSVAWERDVTRCITPFAGVSVITNGELCLSTTSDMIDADTSCGYHLLVIEGYSRTKEIPNGERIRSRPFMVGGHRWCIDYMANGCSPRTADFTSVFLVLRDDIVTKPVKAHFALSCIDHVEKQEPAYIRSTTKAYNFSNDSRDWGYRKFFKRDGFEQSIKLNGDCFTIRADIMICKDLNIDDANATKVPLPDLRQNLNQLLQTKVGADVTFKVSGETFAAHRCVLAARSTVFMAQLFGPMKEGTTAGVIQIKDMEAKVFSALLSFIYTDLFPEMEKDKAQVEEEGQEEGVDATWLQWVQDLFVAADRYDLQGLKLSCEDVLCENIDVSSVTSTLTLAEQHHCHGLKEECLQFLQEQSSSSLQTIMAASDWEHITMTYPSLLNELIAKLARKV